MFIEVKNKRVKRILIIILIVVSIIFIQGCGNSSVDINAIIKEEQHIVEYTNYKYYSDGKNIYIINNELEKKKIMSGAYVFFVNENGIFFSDTNDKFNKSIYRSDLDGENKRLLVEGIVDADFYNDKIYYSSLKEGKDSGEAYNWNPIKSVDLDGKNEKDIVDLKSCHFFCISKYKKQDILYAEIENQINMYSLNGELIDIEYFDEYIFGITHNKEKIYLSSDKYIYEINFDTFTSKKIAPMTANIMSTDGYNIYGLLYKDNSDYNNRKWYKLDVNSCLFEPIG